MLILFYNISPQICLCYIYNESLNFIFLEYDQSASWQEIQEW